MINKIEKEIETKKPNTINCLDSILNKYNMSYKIQQIFYKGCRQGVKVICKINNKKYTIPRKGKVYSIFKLGL